jgi:hypothetical protein
MSRCALMPSRQTQESDMPDENTPKPDDFEEVADKSIDAGIADEGAAYTKAIADEDGGSIGEANYRSH